MRARWLEIILAVVLVLLVLWVVHLRKTRRPPVETERMGPAADFGSLRRLVYFDHHESTVVVRRGQEYWLEFPVQDRADLFFVEEVFRQAQELRATRVLPDTNGATYGLHPAVRGVRLEGAKGSWGLDIGDKAPVGSQVYARLAGPTSVVLLLDDFTVRKYFAPSLTTIRDPSAIWLRTGPVDSVAVVMPGGEVRARRIGADRWQTRIPARGDVDPLAMNQVVQLLRGPKLIGYPAPDATRREMGLDPPRGIWVLYQGARRETVAVGRGTSDQGGVYIIPAGRRTPAILSSDLFRLLVGGWPALADRHLLAAPAESVTTVEFLGLPRKHVLRRGQGGWFCAPMERRLERGDAFERDLANLSRLQWIAFPTADLQPGRAGRLRLRLASAATAETLELAAPADSIGWARSTRRHAWGEVRARTWSTWEYWARQNCGPP